MRTSNCEYMSVLYGGRCISDHHREARYPYLDEAFVDYMNSLPMWIKVI